MFFFTVVEHVTLLPLNVKYQIIQEATPLGFLICRQAVMNSEYCFIPKALLKSRNKCMYQYV